MGTKGREIIISMNVERLVTLLNQAYASEWLASLHVSAYPKRNGRGFR
jgi:hypothetical protein